MFGLAITMIVRSARPKGMVWTGCNITNWAGNLGATAITGFFFVYLGCTGTGRLGRFLFFVCNWRFPMYPWDISFLVILSSSQLSFLCQSLYLYHGGLLSSLVPPCMNLEILSINQNLSFMWPLPLIAKISGRTCHGQDKREIGV